MELKINSKYPSVDDLRDRARRRIPRFAFEYLDGGCNEDVNLHRNTAEIRDVVLKPYYLTKHTGSDLQTELFGHTYDAPFGIAPVGLQGLMWPKSPEILAKAAFDYNIPFVLSTVSTSSIETIAEITEGRAWFQLYHPAEDELRDDIIQRADSAGCPVLVILCDVPTFGYRPRDIRNGLAMPPKMTLRNIMQIFGKPSWAVNTLLAGSPQFRTMTPYTPKGLSLKNLGYFMDKTFSGRLNDDKVKAIRDMWKGKLVLKGVASEEDTERAIALGIDGIIVSNHGGRQLDGSRAPFDQLSEIVDAVGDKIDVICEGGIQRGTHVLKALSLGAKACSGGRLYLYALAAAGQAGVERVLNQMRNELERDMKLMGCKTVNDLSRKNLRFRN